MSRSLKLLGGLLVLGAIVGVVAFWGRFNAPVAESESTPFAISLADVEVSSVVTPVQVKQLNWNLHGDFRVSEEGLILLQNQDTIVNVIDGKSILDRPSSELRSFCFAGEGIVAVCGKWLCGYDDALGVLEPLIELPSDQMQLADAGDANSFYLFESTAAGSDIYAVATNGSYSKLAHTDEPILAVTGLRGRLFFSVWNKIFTWKHGESLTAIVDLAKAMQKEETAPITSLAIDPSTGILFFSSGEGVYALAGGNVALLLVACTGDLQFSNGRLFVKDRVQEAILDVRNAIAAVGAGTATPAASPDPGNAKPIVENLTPGTGGSGGGTYTPPGPGPALGPLLPLPPTPTPRIDKPIPIPKAVPIGRKQGGQAVPD